MTLPQESKNSISKAREFLFELMDSKKTPGISREIRDKARSILKHFPIDEEIKIKDMHDPNCGVVGWGKGKDE